MLHRLDEFSIPEGYASLSIMAPLDINWKQLPVQSEWTYSGCGISSQLTMNARSFTYEHFLRHLRSSIACFCRLAHCVFQDLIIIEELGGVESSLACSWHAESFIHTSFRSMESRTASKPVHLAACVVV